MIYLLILFGMMYVGAAYLISALLAELIYNIKPEKASSNPLMDYVANPALIAVFVWLGFKFPVALFTLSVGSFVLFSIIALGVAVFNFRHVYNFHLSKEK
ncbi:MAG: hypothetical protein VX730_07580 [Pseudomonadota bacterium]|nr:hypothetical protein [Pseudomonadota bacterium]